MKCMLCGKNAGIAKRKIYNGYICGTCSRKVPDFLRSSLDTYSDLRLKVVNSYFTKNSKKEFEKTASYGSLVIDEIDGLFQIKTPDGSYIFDPVDMAEGDIICTDPRANSHNMVYVDVEFFYKMENPCISMRIKIKKNVKCQSKRTSESTLEWNEPSDLIMFRNMFNQMLERHVTKKYSDMARNSIKYVKAKALFLTDDNYTEEEIKNTRKKLMKVFHPDTGETDLEKAEIINRYYDFLLHVLIERRKKD